VESPGRPRELHFGFTDVTNWEFAHVRLSFFRPDTLSTRVSIARITARRMLHAVEQIRRMRGGAQSHLMRCSDDNSYVVKFQNNLQHRRILVNELLGTRLAGRLGLPTTRWRFLRSATS
jgi:HipA-like kinase